MANAYNQNLLVAGTTEAQQPLLSLPVLVNPAVPYYTGVVIDRNAVVFPPDPVKVANSKHAVFASDSALLRATWRSSACVTSRSANTPAQLQANDARQNVVQALAAQTEREKKS